MAEEIISLVKSSLRSAGKKEIIAKAPREEKEYFPSLHLDAQQLPELAGYDVEDSIALIVKGVIKSHSIDGENDQKQESFNIEIKKIGLVKKE